MTPAKKMPDASSVWLQLPQELRNVSKACRLMAYSRQQFYEIRRNHQIYGAEGLLDRLPEVPRFPSEPRQLPRPRSRTLLEVWTNRAPPRLLHPA